MKENPLRKYLRPGGLPHFYCPGCGAAQVLNFFTRAADAVGLDFDRLVAIGGVGCTARIPVYLHAEALHGVHGRTLPWATGIKMHNPELKVVIFAGDGDAAAIGGNHLIQAARRNLDVVMIVVNNFTFGMTGGQMAPTTPTELKSATTPYGNPEKPFDLCRLAEVAGATLVSRWSTTKPLRATQAIKRALNHKGFAFVEIISQCTTNFGRRALGTGGAVKMLEWMEGYCISSSNAQKLDPEDVARKVVLGDFVHKQAPVFAGSSVMQGDEETCDG